jgi:hypothetical protein
MVNKDEYPWRVEYLTLEDIPPPPWWTHIQSPRHPNPCGDYTRDYEDVIDVDGRVVEPEDEPLALEGGTP